MYLSLEHIIYPNTLHLFHWYIVHHAINENKGAKAVAPVEVLGISSSFTLTCGSS